MKGPVAAPLEKGFGGPGGPSVAGRPTMLEGKE